MSLRDDPRRPLAWRVLTRDAPALLALAAPFLAAPRLHGAPDLAWAGVVGYLVLLVAPAVDPRRRTRWDRKPLPSARLGWAVVCAVGALVQARALAEGHGDHAGRVEGLVAVVLLGVLGNALPALRPNWFFGIRTPWTLRDDRVWDRTHRVAGHALVGASALLAGLWAALDAATFDAVFTMATVALVAFAVAYPWWLSRRLASAGGPAPRARV